MLRFPYLCGKEIEAGTADSIETPAVAFSKREHLAVRHDDADTILEHLQFTFHQLMVTTYGHRDGMELLHEVLHLCREISHHAEIIHELLQGSGDILLKSLRDDVELAIVQELDTVAAVLQDLKTIGIDEHPADCRSVVVYHISRLPAEELEKTVGILTDDCPALTAREDVDVNILLPLHRHPQDMHR